MSEQVSEASLEPAPKQSLVYGLVKRKIIRFAAVGAVSTLIDIGVYNLALRGGLGVYVAGATGFFAGFSNGYFMNSRYVFRKGSHVQYAKYLIISFIGLLLTELILDIGHVRLGLTENIAKLAAVFVVFIWNYTMSKYWAFR